MNQSSIFNGIFPPVPTIVDSAGELDKKGMGLLIDFLIDSGVNGLLILGTGGEFSQMSLEMKKEVAQFSVEYINKRVPILLGTSSTSTKEAVELGKFADLLAVDGVLALNPYYVLLNDDCLFNHYKTIADQINTPIILYNFPALTGQNLEVSMIKRLAVEIPSVIGIKDTIDNISHIREIINQVRPVCPDFVVFSGFDEYLMDSLILGANGGIPATTNFIPELTCGVYKAYQEKNYEEMFRLHRKLSSLSSIYTLEMPFFGVIKEAIKFSGLDISTDVLPPSLPLSKDKKEELKQLLDSI